jgi:Tol biopolymer transport system component
VLASLNHPNIAQVHGLEESAGTTALVMELVEGQDLSDHLAARPLSVHQALQMAQQIAAALEFAHEQAVIHRDLKPANIKIRPDGTVKVLDFGLAKSLTPTDEHHSTVTMISAAGLIIGTPAYMSPEQARGESTGRETDIWAFGVVFYQMLTGVSPFGRRTSADTLVQVLSSPVDESLLPAAVPGSIRRLIRRCLERDLKRRWHSMGDARIEIEEALAHPAETSGTEGVPVAAPAVRVSRRHVLVTGVGVLGAVAAGVGGGVWLDRQLRPSLVPAYRRLTFRRGVIRSAHVAPDGETILYGALWENNRCRVHSVRLDGPESKPLDLPDANILAISRSGDLALALGRHEEGVFTYGTLARVPLAGGAPRPIINGVKFADWSPDGQELAIVRYGDTGDHLEFPAGRVLVAPVAGGTSGLGFPRVSPDGTRVAFLRYRTPLSLAGRVEIVDRSGATTVLSPEYLNIHGLCWRGNDLVYTAADDRPLFRALRTVNPGGGESRTVVRLPGNSTVWDTLPDGRLVLAQTDDHGVLMAKVAGDTSERDLSWLDAPALEDLSADGRWLLFTEGGQGGGHDSAAYLRATDASPAIHLGSGRALALSPDAKWAICGPTGLPPWPYLVVIPTGAGQSRRLEGHGLSYRRARCLADGKRIIVSANEPDRQARLFVHDLGTARPVPITPEGAGPFVVSPNDSTVAVKFGTAIRLYDVNDPRSTPREIPGLSGTESPASWTTGGLLVVRYGDPAATAGAVTLIDPKTGRQSLWRDVWPRDRAGLLVMGTFRATPDGTAYAYSWFRALSNLYVAEGLD